MKHPLIGLYSPHAQSGKTTAALYLMYHMHGLRMSFADPMREALIPIVAPFMPGGEDEVREWFKDDRKDKAEVPGLGVTLRFLMQTLGTSWGRETIHPDVWERITLVRSRLERRHNPIILDDVRFENEYAMVKREEGLLVKIVRPDASPSGNFWHKSEARLENLPFDVEVVNDGSLEDLRASMRRLAADHFGA